MLQMRLFAVSFVFSLIGCSVSGTKDLSVDGGKTKLFPCPPSEELYPCRCVLQNSRVDMDCSNAESNEQMNFIFQNASFIAKDCYEFSMYQNYRVASLSVDFNEVFYEVFTISSSDVLEEIKENVFSTSASSLSQITVSSNDKLKTFPFSSIQLTPNLTILTISVSNISFLPPLINAKLERVSVSSSKLSSIAPGTFTNTPQLKSIDVSGNDIAYITTNSFPVGEDMEIDLATNYINSTGIRAFYDGTATGLPAYRFLSLSRNKLKSLEANTIPITRISPTGLNTLYLEENEIATIHPDAFYMLGNTFGVNYLDIHLSDNQLTTIDEAVFSQWMTIIKYIRAGDNPIECACNIAWLVTNELYMDKIYSGTRCEDGTELKSLDPAYYINYC